MSRGGKKPLETSQKKVEIEGKTYCRFFTFQGAAGSAYFTYKYSTIKKGKQITLEFTLRYPDCGALSEINDRMQRCQKEEDVFNPDILAHQILSTFRFLE